MQKRHFIAGASCPKCGLVDTIVKIIDGESVLFQCNQCDFLQNQADDFNERKPLPGIQTIRFNPKKGQHKK